MLLITDDDESLFASFLCLRYQPHVVVCLRSHRMGERSYPHRQFRMTFQEREAETAAAMEILGCSWEQWTIPDNLPEPEGYLRPALARLEEREWDQVFAPAVEEEGQFQHNLIGELAAGTFGADKLVSYYTYTKQGRTRDGYEVPYEPSWLALKLRALSCYTTQAAHPSTRPWFLQPDLREWTERPVPDWRG